MNPRSLVLGCALAWAGTPAQAATLAVPGQYPTIQGAMDVAGFGDTVLVAPGTYDDWETRGVIPHTAAVFMVDGVTLVSEAGPDVTTIRVDGGGVGSPQVIEAGGLPSQETVIEGFTLTGTMPVATGIWAELSGKLTVRNCRFVELGNGRATGGGIWMSDMDLDLEGCEFLRCEATGFGGGVSLAYGKLRADACYFEECDGEGLRLIDMGVDGHQSYVTNCQFVRNQGTALVIQASRATVRDCVFLENTNGFDGAISISNSGLTAYVTQCLFVGNIGGGGAGAITVGGGGGAITRNTFVGNAAPAVSGCWFISSAPINFNRNIFVGHTQSPAVRAGSQPHFTNLGCNLFWQNSGGDVQGYTVAPTSIFADPQFCGPETGDYTVYDTSPCLPENGSGCDQIGVYGEGCGGPLSIQDGLLPKETWARVKGYYR